MLADLFGEFCIVRSFSVGMGVFAVSGFVCFNVLGLLFTCWALIVELLAGKLLWGFICSRTC